MPVRRRRGAPPPHPACAASRAGFAQIHSESRDEKTGEDCVTWHSVRYDLARQTMRLVAWTDRLDAGGYVASRRYSRMNLSWITPEQARSLLAAAGFEIEHSWGGFDRTPLTPESKTQIWVARRE